MSPMRRESMRQITPSFATNPQSTELHRGDAFSSAPWYAEADLVRAVNTTRNIIVASRVVWATGSAKRRGLLGCSRLDADEGMYLVPCQWVHMFGMQFAIDVAFLGRNGCVLAVHHGLRPNRLSRLVLRADGVLELASGVLREKNTIVGDHIEFVDL